MNYIINSKNRKLKHKIHLLVDRLSFNFLNLTLSQKIVLLWITISFVSLFFNWFTIEYDNAITNTAFSINSGYVGYIIMIFSIWLAFIVLSNTNKEKIKSKTHLVFHDYSLMIFCWVLFFLLTLTIFNSVRWLTMLFKNITTWKGMIFELVWSVFVIIWWIVNYKEKKQDLLNKVYIENSKFEAQADLDEYRDIIGTNKDQNRGNMSLPI